MGKSNRIKEKKQNERAQSLSDYSRKQKKQMPSWVLNVVAAALAILLVVSVALIALSQNGVFLRVQTAMSSEHYKVNGNMMKYYFQTQYQNFVTNYESYMSMLSLDTSKPLKSQTIQAYSAESAVYDTSLVGSEYEGRTWFDYFMDQTKNEVRDMLFYCEEADKLGIELDDSDEETVDNSIESIRTTAVAYGYTLDSYLANAFGKGISESDVRKAMELSTLASKAMAEISKRLEAEISDELIQSTYDADAKSFNLIDYTYYTFRVSYSTVETETKEKNENATEEDILNAYKAEIAEAKKNAAELLAITDPAEFEKYVLTYIADDAYDTEYDEAVDGITENIPSDENLAKIREEMVKDIIEEAKVEDAVVQPAAVKDGDKYTVYGVEVSEAFASAFDQIKSNIFDTVVSNKTTYVKDEASYTEGDEFSTWAFDADRKANDVTKIDTGDKGEGDEFELKDKYFYSSVYILRTPQRPDGTKTHNVAYMFFTNEADAVAAIDALKAEGTVNKEVFDRIANEKGASSVDIYKNYMEGDMGSDDFDEWLYADTTVIGSYSTEVVALSESTYGVFLYESEGMEAWKVTVQSSILEQKFTEYTETMQTTYADTIKIRDRVCAKAAD